jgi:acetylornithine aminotransferase
MASFHTKSKSVLSTTLSRRTSAAVATTDNPKIVAPMNAQQVVDTFK